MTSRHLAGPVRSKDAGPLTALVLECLAPRPGITEPELGQNVQRGAVRTAVGYGDPNENVVRRVLRVFRSDVEITVRCKYAGVDEFELELELAAPTIFLHEPFVRVGGLRVFVEAFKVGTGRGRIKVVVEFFDVLAMVTFRSRQTKQTFLQNRILTVP